MKVFVDTNVLASAFATRGMCADVLRTVLSEHEIVICKQVISEVQDVLHRKFHLPQSTITGILELLHRFALAPAQAETAGIHVRDADDIAILASALAANADVLITGDRDLLIIGKYENLRILSPRGFWEMLRSSGRSGPL